MPVKETGLREGQTSSPRTVRSYSGVLVAHMWHCIKFALASDLRGLEEITDGVETVGSSGAETMSAHLAEGSPHAYWINLTH